jgi:hypothetical protein
LGILAARLAQRQQQFSSGVAFFERNEKSLICTFSGDIWTLLVKISTATLSAWQPVRVCVNFCATGNRFVNYTQRKMRKSKTEKKLEEERSGLHLGHSQTAALYRAIL